MYAVQQFHMRLSKFFKYIANNLLHKAGIYKSTMTTTEFQCWSLR